MSKSRFMHREFKKTLPFTFEICSENNTTSTGDSRVNNKNIVVTAYDGYNVSTEIDNLGFEYEKIKYIFSGDVYYNKPVVVGKIEITAKDINHYIKGSPYIKTNSEENIKIILTKTKKYNRKLKNKYYYCFNIVYRNTEPTTRQNGLTSEIYFNQQKHLIRSGSIIDTLTFGSELIPHGGGGKTIKIKGTPYSSFILAVNENQVSKELTTSGSETGRWIFNKHNDTSILTNANSTALHNYGREIKVIKGNLDSVGSYTHQQFFPGISKVKLNGAVTSSNTLVLDGVPSDLKVGDRLISVDYCPLGTVKKIQSLAPATNRIILDGTVTIPDNTIVGFHRDYRSYSIDLIPDGVTKISNKLLANDPTFILKQYRPIIPSFEFKVPSFAKLTSLKVNDKVETIGSLAFGADYIHYFSVLNTNKIMNPSLPFYFELILTANTAGGAAFNNLNRKEVFNSGTDFALLEKESELPQSYNHLSNTNPKNNGGTTIDLQSSNTFVSTTSAANDTFTVRFWGYITETGETDFTMSLDIDDIIANTP